MKIKLYLTACLLVLGLSCAHAVPAKKGVKRTIKLADGTSVVAELKGDEFVKSQMLIITENQKKITELKLKKAGLDSFKVWLFMGNQKD